MQAIKRRKPLVALLMSGVLPGFGQLYNGEVNKAIWLFIAFSFVSIPVLAFLALNLPGRTMAFVLLLTLVSAIGIWIHAMADAWRHARARQDYVPARWQTSGLYALVLIVGSVITLPATTIYVRAHFFESFRIPSQSMEPSVLRGDFVTADKRYNCRGCKHRIERGDIAIFTYPNDRTQLYLKRIIALPGDHVRIEGSTVEINGRPLTRSTENGDALEITERSPDGREWRVRWQTEPSGLNDLELTVPPGEVFVLGDNRSNSSDSRNLGTIPTQDVVGRARQVWFSIGPDGIRWSRLGHQLR